MTRLRCSTSMAHGVQLWGSLAMRGLTDSAQYMEKVQKDGSGPGSASYLRVGPALFFMSSYFTICQRQTAVSSGPWVDAKFFTAPSACTEEPVFVTFLHTLLQLPFLKLCPLCASLKIAGSAIWRIDLLRLALRASPAVRILHQTIVQTQIMVRKGAQRSKV